MLFRLSCIGTKQKSVLDFNFQNAIVNLIIFKLLYLLFYLVPPISALRISRYFTLNSFLMLFTI